MAFDVFWHGILRQPYRLPYTVHGDPTKPVVILLHGIAASGESWSQLIPLLTPHYFCITIDLLGFGASPKPQWADYTIEQHVRSLRYTIQSLTIRGTYTIVGHSLGSLLATRYARQYPHRINHLLLLSPPVYPPLDTIQGKLALKRTDVLMRLYRALREHPRATPENIRRLSQFHLIPHSVALHPDIWIPFVRSLENCIEQQTIRRDLRSVRIPVDVFYGSLDTVVIGENIRSLNKIRDVRVHTFRGNHKLGAAYARAVARVLMRSY